MVQMEQNRGEIIKKRVQDGSFFADGKDWFYKKYVSSYKTKFDILVIVVIIFFLLTFFVINSIIGVSSVVPKNGVVKLEENFGGEFVVEKIPRYYQNNEKNIVRFILESYLKVFESYDVDKFDIYKLDAKAKIIKNHSSDDVGRFFANVIKENYVNEVFSGVFRDVAINSFEFISQDEVWYKNIINRIMPEEVPRKVKINFTSFVLDGESGALLQKQDRTVEISFFYNNIKRDKNGEFEDLNFKVLSYRYINLGWPK